MRLMPVGAGKLMFRLPYLLFRFKNVTIGESEDFDTVGDKGRSVRD